MKKINRDKLLISKSMILPFNGNHIFYSSLDGLNVYDDIAKDKFLDDIKLIKRPSSPSLVAVHLYKTHLEEELANIIITKLHDSGNSVRKVAFVGLTKKGIKLVRSIIKKINVAFISNFFSDYEKAKLWLVD